MFVRKAKTFGSMVPVLGAHGCKEISFNQISLDMAIILQEVLLPVRYEHFHVILKNPQHYLSKFIKSQKII